MRKRFENVGQSCKKPRNLRIRAAPEDVACGVRVSRFRSAEDQWPLALGGTAAKPPWRERGMITRRGASGHFVRTPPSRGLLPPDRVGVMLGHVCSGVWSHLGADPHAHTPRCHGGHREDTDDDRDQLPPRIFAAVSEANCDQSKHGGDAGSGCRHPHVVAAREPAGENAGREDGQRPDRKRLGQPKDREHDKEAHENRDRSKPPHLSIVGGTATLVKPCPW